MQRRTLLQALLAPATRPQIRVQFDAADHRNVPLPPAAWLNYLFHYIDQPNSQIRSIAWDLSLGDTFAVYPSRLLPPSPDLQITKWRNEGFHWVPEILKAARQRKIQNVWHHRFSEVDIRPEGGLELEQRRPLKAQNPDWLIRSWWWQGLWNIASPGLRAHKLEILKEVAQSLDIDGIQIDFARHIPCLPPGRQWELRHHATEFMRQLRRMLRATNLKLELSAKVPETLAGCKTDGFDIATWARENLIDSLTLGSRAFTVNVEEIRAAVGPNIHLSPCLDDHHATDGYRYPPIEIFRGVATNWLAQGANSVTTFNWSAAPNHGGPISHQQAYTEIGSLETMRRKPKRYLVERRGGYPWAEGYFNRNDHMPLPAKLSNDGRSQTFPLRLHDLEIQQAELTILLFQSRPTDQLQVTCNTTPLTLTQPDNSAKDPQIFSPKPQPNSGGKGDYTIDPKQSLRKLTYAVPLTSLKTGPNQVTIKIQTRAAYRPGEDIQIEKIELATTPS